MAFGLMLSAPLAACASILAKIFICKLGSLQPMVQAGDR